MQKNEANRRGAYVHEVREGTDRYVRDLLNENQALCRQIAGMETEAAVLKRQNTRLEEQMSAVRAGVEHDLQLHEDLRQRLADVEGQNHSFSERYVQVEQQNNDLANLYVACYRLHGTLDHEEVLAGIQEVIINLIGCEEFGIFELDAERSTLRLSSSFGLDAESYRSIPLGSGLIGRAVSRGERFWAGQSDDSCRLSEEADLTACIPLEVDGRATGALAIFRLLPQKAEGLCAIDHELFDLLATQAGVALHACALQAAAVAASAKGVSMATFSAADARAAALEMQS